MSRAAAERHLLDILTAGGGAPEPGPAPQWQVTQHATPIQDNSASWLERRFYKVFRELVADLSAHVSETPGEYGNRMRFRLPGQDRSWILEPQILMQGSKPDFVLRSDDAQIPQMAIFTDGRGFHASVAHNRIADDAAKRAVLRDAGVYVLSVTTRDVDAEQDGQSLDPPRWWAERIRPTLTSLRPTTAEVLDNVTAGPFGILRKWLTSAPVQSQRDLGTWLPLGLLAAHQNSHHPGGELAQRAADILRAGDGSGEAMGWWLAEGLTVGVRASGNLIACCAMIDDRDIALADDASHAAWRDWLALANQLQLSNAPVVITTLTSEMPAQVMVGAAGVDQQPTLSPEWEAAYEDCLEDEDRALVAELAHADVPVVTVGYEIGSDNLPVELAWPDRHIVVRSRTLAADQVERLQSEGWSVVPATVEAITAAMEGAAP